MNNIIINKKDIIKNINDLIYSQDKKNANTYLEEVVVRYILYFMNTYLLKSEKYS